MLKAEEAQRQGGEGYGTKASNDAQRAFLRQALDKDPTPARAWAWEAKCRWREVIMGWVEDRDAAIAATLAASEKALEINPTNWEARCYRALALVFGQQEFVESEVHARESVRLNPSDTIARHALGCVLENVGKTEEALEHLNAVFRLNPNHPNTAAVLGDIVTCNMLLERHDAAVEAATRLIAIAPNYGRGLQRAIAALVRAGETQRAKDAVARLRAVQPDFDEAYVRATYPFRDPEVLDIFANALRDAGAFDAAGG